MKKLKTSSRMALILGVFLPIAETVRRWDALFNATVFFRWADDVVLGAGLVTAAILVYTKHKNAAAMLLVSWSVALGGLVLSLFGQLDDFFRDNAENGTFFTGFVLIAKICITAYIVTGLYLSLSSIKTILQNE